jgi:hypothetical protein
MPSERPAWGSWGICAGNPRPNRSTSGYCSAGRRKVAPGEEMLGRDARIPVVCSPCVAAIPTRGVPTQAFTAPTFIQHLQQGLQAPLPFLAAVGGRVGLHGVWWRSY